MGGGGFAMDAVNVVRANRSLLKKRRSYKNLRSEYEGYTQKTKLKFKELTPVQQELIKNEIRLKAKKDQVYNLRISIVALLLLLGVFGFLYWKYMA
ncbi:hypothetical protein [Maribacter sp. 2210JD10-5]|uniref:hypothetical protein n=1 Tax=Maribacter sp. 2210JD10-5 TaxID=3386272 RepID=UPI0039BC39F6